MPDPNALEVPAEAVIADLKAQLADKCGELAVTRALLQQVATNKVEQAEEEP